MTDTTSPVGLDELLQALRGGQDEEGTPSPGMLMPGQPAAPPAPPPVQSAPPPTDDPGLAMPAIPKPPDLTNSPLAQLLTKTNQDQSAIAAVPKPDPAKLGPRLWERIAGGLLGATQLRNPENAGAVADSVVHRRLNAAQRDYDVKTGPMYKQLATDREGLPVAEAQAKIPQQDYENKLQSAREGREQIAAKSLAQHRSDLDDIKQQIADGNIEKAKDALDQKQKELEQRASFQKDSLQLKRDVADLQDEVRRKSLDDREKAISAKTDPNGYSASEAREIDRKGRMYQGRISAWQKQRSDYLGSKNADDIAALKAGDAEEEANHQKLSDIEDEVIGRRTAKPQQAAPAGNSTPAAASKPAAAAASASPPESAWKDKTAILVTRNKATGATQRWKLASGKPVLVSEEKNGNRN